MKKKLCIMMVVFAVTAVSKGFAFKMSFFPLGYMNHVVTVKYYPNTFGELLQNNIENEFGGIDALGSIESKDKYNAYTLGADMQIFNFFYTGIRVGLPAQVYRTGRDPMVSRYKDIYDKGAQKVKSIIVDSQFGFCYPLSVNKFTLSFGLGAALNYVKVEQKLNRDIQLKDSTFMKNVVDYNQIFQTGLGVNISVGYRFLPHWSVDLALTDSFLYYSMISKRYVLGTVNDAQMKLEFKGKDKKSNRNLQYANNFVLALGVSASL